MNKKNTLEEKLGTLSATPIPLFRKNTTIMIIIFAILCTMIQLSPIIDPLY